MADLSLKIWLNAGLEVLRMNSRLTSCFVVTDANNEQQDAHELLMFILHQMDNEIGGKETSMIKEFFYGLYETKKTCVANLWWVW